MREEKGCLLRKEGEPFAFLLVGQRTTDQQLKSRSSPDANGRSLRLGRDEAFWRSCRALIRAHYNADSHAAVDEMNAPISDGGAKSLTRVASSATIRSCPCFVATPPSCASMNRRFSTSAAPFT